MTAPASLAATSPQPEPPSHRWPGWLRWPFRLACVAFGGWLLICLLLAMYQRRLIYHPTRVPALPPPPNLPWASVEPLEFVSADGLTLHGWRLTPKRSLARSDSPVAPAPSKPTPVVLYFCGNAGHRGYRLDEFELLAAAGAEVCCFDYRGYGDNAGTPSEADLRRDARAAWNLLTGPLGIPPGRIILLGESLGGGVATRLAADLCADQQIPGGLVLRSTFHSLREIAASQFEWVPVSLLLLDRFESWHCVGLVTCPLLSLHGERDSIVPLTSGRALFDTAPPQSHNGIAKRFVPLPRADHNDVIETEALLVLDELQRFFAVEPTR